MKVDNNNVSLTNGDYIRSATDEELAEILEDIIKAHVGFWITPEAPSLDHWEQDKKMQLEWLKSKRLQDVEIGFI